MITPTWQRQVMRRVGSVLVFVGAADVASCGFAIANRMSYESSLNIFVLVAGIMVYRGHLGAVRFVVRWFSFMLGAFILSPIPAVLMTASIPGAWPSPVPWGDVAFSLLSIMVLVALFLWVRQSLAALPVFEGNRPARPLLRTPETAVGAAIPITVVIVLIASRAVGLLG